MKKLCQFGWIVMNYYALLDIIVLIAFASIISLESVIFKDHR